MMVMTFISMLVAMAMVISVYDCSSGGDDDWVVAVGKIDDSCNNAAGGAFGNSDCFTFSTFSQDVSVLNAIVSIQEL